MLRREGRSLGNLLSLLAGLGIVVAAVVCLASLLAAQSTPVMLALALFVLMLTAWVGFLLASFMVYSWLYQLFSQRGSADFVMVHGSGLINGRVPKLLASRVDAGITRWQTLRQANPAVRLIMSGGKGADEPRSEAAAMAEYALSRGVPQAAISVEDNSATTEQNLEFSKDLVVSEFGPKPLRVTPTKPQFEPA